MPIIQEHFNTADEKERSGRLKKKKKKKKKKRKKKKKPYHFHPTHQ